MKVNLVIDFGHSLGLAKLYKHKHKRLSKNWSVWMRNMNLCDGDERKLRSLRVHNTVTKRPLHDFLNVLYYVFNNEKSIGCKFIVICKNSILPFFHMHMKTSCNF